MTNSDIKVLRVIKYNEDYIKTAISSGATESYIDVYGFIKFTTLWYIKRNLEYYKEMLGKDKRKLPDYLKELYQSI